MKKIQYFQIKSKIYYYTIVVLGILISVILTVISGILVVGGNKSSKPRTIENEI